MNNTVPYLLIAFLLVIVIILVRHINSAVVYRFTKPTCPFCIKSQGAWDEFVSRCGLSNIRTVEVDMTKASAEEAELYKNLEFEFVPSMALILPNGSRYSYRGDHDADLYMAWVRSHWE